MFRFEQHKKTKFVAIRVAIENKYSLSD